MKKSSAIDSSVFEFKVGLKKKGKQVLLPKIDSKIFFFLHKILLNWFSEIIFLVSLWNIDLLHDKNRLISMSPRAFKNVLIDIALNSNVSV